MAQSKESFIGKRTAEIQGMIVIATGIYIALSLLTYHSSDPSYNIASSDDVQNLGGKFGAYISDPFLQFFGLAAVFAAFAPLVWGIRIFKKQDLKFFWFKLILLITSLVSFSAAFSLFDTVEAWPFQSFGGYIGMFISQRLIVYMSVSAFTLIATVIGLTTLYYAIGISFYSWLEIFIKTGAVIRFMFLLISQAVKRAIQQVSGKDLGVKDKSEIKKDFLERIQPQISARKEKVKKEKQKSLNLQIPNSFELPSVEFLTESPKIKKNVLSEDALEQNAKMLERVLEDFGVNGKITNISPGPVVTLYELEPSPGTKSSRVIGLADDISRSMSSVSARIAVIPGKNAIGIELPNTSRETVYLRELIESDEFREDDANLPLVLGKNISGEPVVADLSRMPHLLVAGTTGSGKSVAINAMILSLLYKFTPDQCKFIMIDPKMLELSVYDGIPHLLTPVVTEPKKAIVALKWVVREMENRYRLMSNLGVRNVAGYNKRIEEAVRKGETITRSVQTGFDVDSGEPKIETVPLNMQPLPFIVVVVDEMADLMIVAGKDIEGSVQRLAQMARAAGIHIIMATQRPSVDVITGVIKANFPTRISFQVTSRIDSRTILNEPGAEQLLGMGDMLYMSGGSRITRVHGPFVSDEEVEEVVSFLKNQGSPAYVEDVTEDEGDSASFDFGETGGDDLYRQAVQIVLRDRKASTSYIQRCLKIGYNRAANLIDKMEKEGIVSQANHVGKREILKDE